MMTSIKTKGFQVFKSVTKKLAFVLTKITEYQLLLSECISPNFPFGKLNVSVNTFGYYGNSSMCLGTLGYHGNRMRVPTQEVRGWR